jgi:Type II secretion system (T2SS), protein E, N-terminal domain
MSSAEYRPLLMRANRLLGSALIEHNLVKFEDLEAANERLLEVAASGQVRQSSVLNILIYEKKVLREEDVLHHVVDDHGVGVVDLRGYEVPEEVRREIDLDACWATWSVPFDREEDFHFVATAYYLSPAVRSHWEKKLGGRIIWQATTMDIIADFLDRLQVERNDAAKRGGSRPPFPIGSSISPLPVKPGSTPPMPTRPASTPPMPVAPLSSGHTPIPFPSSSLNKPASTH